MNGLPERECLVALAHVVEPSDTAATRWVAQVGADSAVERIARGDAPLTNADALTARWRSYNPDSARKRAAAVGARVITRLDAQWPTQLADLGERQPFALWLVGAGDLRLLALRSVAMVGARACTSYGAEVAYSWAAEFAAAGWCVISGGAFGIDVSSHRGALAAGAPTVCVLAGGVDVMYPRAHERTLACIADEGVLVSESPPGAAARRQRFLSRNRLIAGLSRATLIVEAAARSGSIATAHAALAMNRPVLAVPGPVTSAASVGCHRMIRDGDALLVDSAADVFELLDFDRISSRPPQSEDSDRSPGQFDLTPAERAVLDVLPARGWVGGDAMLASCDLPGAALWSAVGTLEAAGRIESDGAQWRLARRAR